MVVEGELAADFILVVGIALSILIKFPVVYYRYR